MTGSMVRTQPEHWKTWGDALQTMLDHGSLARRVLRAASADFSKTRLAIVYRELCDCLEEGRMFLDWIRRLPGQVAPPHRRLTLR